MMKSARLAFLPLPRDTRHLLSPSSERNIIPAALAPSSRRHGNNGRVGRLPVAILVIRLFQPGR